VNLYDTKRGCGKPIEGAPTIFYLVVSEDRAPAVRCFVTIDGVHQFVLRHAQDKKDGFDWGAYEIFVVNTEGPEIERCEIKTIMAEMKRLIEIEVRERVKQIEEQRSLKHRRTAYREFMRR
jgi:hypothetical protein